VQVKNPCGFKPLEAHGLSHYAQFTATGFFSQIVKSQAIRD
jgi:hypothetical protein